MLKQWRIVCNAVKDLVGRDLISRPPAHDACGNCFTFNELLNLSNLFTKLRWFYQSVKILQQEFLQLF